MHQFKDLVQYIMDNGRIKSDRTGVGTMSVFGYQVRFDLSQGFPLETLKKTFFRGVLVELLGFIKGVTNNSFFTDHNVHIWDDWAVKEDVVEKRELTPHARVMMYSQRRQAEDPSVTFHDTQAELRTQDAETQHGGKGREAYMTDYGIPLTEDVVVAKAGDLGPIYGSQWRSWPNYRDGKTIDQLAEAIHLLKTKPTSRRIIVSAWNPADLPDESKPPHVNAAEGFMCLSACHTMFQFMAEPLTLEERFTLDSTFCPVLEERAVVARSNHGHAGYVKYVLHEISDFDRDVIIAALDERNIPKYRLSCQLYQRSADTMLGVPFNIASYALLTMMVAQCVNMVPGDFVHTFGDAHLYLNHFEANGAEEGIETMMQREPYPYPTLLINPDVKNIDDFTVGDFKLVNYQSHPAIKLPVAV